MTRSRATWLTSAPFRAPAPGRVCGQLYNSDRIRRVRSCAVAFLLPFGRRHLLHGHPFPPWNSAPFAVGLPGAGQFSRTIAGFPRSARVSRGRIRVSSLPRGHGAHVTGYDTPATTAAFQQQTLDASTTQLPLAIVVTRLPSRLHFRSPFPAFPLPVASGQHTGSWAFPRASYPARSARAAHAGGGDRLWALARR